jgi:hypothetical protein
MLLLREKWGYINHFMENKFIISSLLSQSNGMLHVKLMTIIDDNLSYSVSI